MDKNSAIKATGIASSSAAIFYITFIYIGIKLGLLILLIPLSHFFPIFKEYDWIRFIPEILTLGILISHPFCSFYSVLLYKDSVILKKFGIKIKEIPVSEFKSFCLVGNDREDILCLSRYSFEEMSRMQEARLARGVFSKHELPFMKRKPNWQNDFAKGYLFHLHKSPFNAFKKRNVIMLDMHPALQYSIQKMYPQLPYKNLTEITSPYLSRFSEIPANQVFCFQMQTSEYTFRMENDGIHIETKKEEIFSIPANQIKTAVRIDLFTPYNKFSPPHIPLLFLTTMSEDELSKHQTAKIFFSSHCSETDNKELLAMTAASHFAWRWNKNQTNSCVIPFTEKNLEMLRTLYPHVQINEISSGWISNS